MESTIYQSFFRTAGVGIGLYTTQGQVIDYNDIALQYIDKKRSDTVGKNILDLYPEDKATKYLQRIKDTVKSKDPLVFEDHINLGKKNMWFRSVFSTSLDSNGQIIGVQVISSDITIQKKAEQDLRQSEQINNAILEAIPDMMFVIDSDYIFRSYHAESDKMFYVPPESFINKNISDVLPSDIAELTRKNVDEVLTYGKVRNYEYALEKDGKNQYYEGRMVLQNEGFVLLIVRNITEKKKAEVDLRESELKFKSYTNDSPIAIYVTDINGKCTFVNDKWMKMSGLSFQEALGDGWKKALHPDDENIGAQWEKSAKNNGTWFYEYRFIDKQGLITWVEGSAKPLYDKDNNLIGYLGSNIDITDRKKAEDIIKTDRANLTALIENTSDLIWSIDKKYRLITANSAFIDGMEPLYGGRLEIGDNLLDENRISHTLIERYKTIYDTVLTGERIVEEIPVTYPENSELMEVAYNPTYNQEGKVIGVSVFARDITERKKTENELRKAQIFADKIAETTPALLYIYDNELQRNIWTNEVHKNYFQKIVKNYPEMLYKNVPEIIHQEDFSKVVKKSEEMGKNPALNRFNLDIRIKSADGDWKWMTLIVNTFKRNEKGELLQTIGALFDITEGKQAEEKLKVTEERYRELVDTVNSGIAIYKVVNDGRSGKDYIILEFNQFALQHEKMRKEDVIGKSLKDIRPNIDEYGLIDTFREVWKTGESSFFPAKVYKDDKYSNYYENRVFRIPSGEIVAIYDDVTERETARLELAASEQRFKLLSNLTFEGILIHDNGVVVDANQSLLKMFGYSREEVVGNSIFQLAIPPEFHQEIIGYIQSEQVDPYEIEAIRKDGSRFPVEIVAKAVNINHKTQRVAAIRDITERKKAEEELTKIEWLLTKKPQIENLEENSQPYGDLTELNRDRTILNAVGKEMLKNIVNDYLGLLETSAAVYEKNGDYAFGIFSSGWCKLLDIRAWAITGTKDNKQALESGKWLCHESCWSKASLASIKTGEPSDICCHGGINIYAYPIFAFNEVIGSINFGYGNPPNDMEILTEIATRYDIPVGKLKEEASVYNSRPSYIVDLAKERLKTSAKIIGTLVELDFTRKELEHSRRDVDELLMNSPVCIKKIDLDFNLQFMSDPGVSQLQIDDINEYYGKPYPESFFPDKFKQEMSAKMLEAKQTGKTVEIEGELADTKGTRLWYHHIIVPVKDDKGKLEYLLIVSMDVSERKKAEMELRKYQESLEKKVDERTAELKNKNEELENFNQFFVGRELRMKELKETIEALNNRIEQLKGL